MTEPKLMITFSGTTAAMAWEKVCQNLGLPGRLIPLPPQIRADCGLAWSALVKDQAVILEALNKYNIKYEQILEMR